MRRLAALVQPRRGVLATRQPSARGPRVHTTPSRPPAPGSAPQCERRPDRLLAVASPAGTWKPAPRRRHSRRSVESARGRVLIKALARGLSTPRAPPCRGAPGVRRAVGQTVDGLRVRRRCATAACRRARSGQARAGRRRRCRRRPSRSRCGGRRVDDLDDGDVGGAEGAAAEAVVAGVRGAEVDAGWWSWPACRRPPRPACGGRSGSARWRSAADRRRSRPACGGRRAGAGGGGAEGGDGEGDAGGAGEARAEHGPVLSCRDRRVRSVSGLCARPVERSRCVAVDAGRSGRYVRLNRCTAHGIPAARPTGDRRARPALALGGGKQRALLAILLLNANEVVSTDRLHRRALGRVAAGDGGQEHPALRLAAAQGARRGPARHAPAGLRPAGRARTSSTRRASAPRRRGARRRARARRAQAARGAGLWRGPPLADLEYEPFAQAEIARLRELRLAALEQRIDADLAAGATRSSSASSRRWSPSTRCASGCGPADARAVPVVAPGGGARGLPRRAPRALGGARAGARDRAQAARAGDPAAGPGARPRAAGAAPRRAPAPAAPERSVLVVPDGARRPAAAAADRRAARRRAPPRELVIAAVVAGAELGAGDRRARRPPRRAARPRRAGAGRGVLVARARRRHRPARRRRRASTCCSWTPGAAPLEGTARRRPRAGAVRRGDARRAPAARSAAVRSSCRSARPGTTGRRSSSGRGWRARPTSRCG